MRLPFRDGGVETGVSSWARAALTKNPRVGGLDSGRLLHAALEAEHQGLGLADWTPGEDLPSGLQTAALLTGHSVSSGASSSASRALTPSRGPTLVISANPSRLPLGLRASTYKRHRCKHSVQDKEQTGARGQDSVPQAGRRVQPSRGARPHK